MRDYNKEIPCRTCVACMDINSKLNPDAIDRDKYGICIIEMIIDGIEGTRHLSIVQKDTAGCEMHMTKEENEQWRKKNNG